MSNVQLSIGGRNYTLACADGEEEHVRALGALIEEKIQASGAVGQSEGRMFLFGALMLADELHEARKSTAAPAGAESPELADRLGIIASRIEKLADVLEESASNA